MIRDLGNGDIEPLLGVWYQASLVGHSFLSAEFLERERVEIAERWLPLAETIVFELDGRLAGFLSLVANEVGALFVDPDLYGRGIGRALMDEARVRRPFLELSVFEANEIGRRFYEAYGFELVARRMEERSGQPELRLRLG